jgi:hypothetical protein
LVNPSMPPVASNQGLIDELLRHCMQKPIG